MSYEPTIWIKKAEFDRRIEVLTFNFQSRQFDKRSNRTENFRALEWIQQHILGKLDFKKI